VSDYRDGEAARRHDLMTKETEREADAGKKRRSCGVAALLVVGLVLVSSGGV
jgi:hypothetical protein